MQQQVNFFIDVICGDEKSVVEAINEIVLAYHFETPFSAEETNNRVNSWLRDIRCNSKQIRNDSECSMYIFDYEVLFPRLFEDIRANCPEISFSGYAEFYNDDFGVMEKCSVKYIDN